MEKCSSCGSKNVSSWGKKMDRCNDCGRVDFADGAEPSKLDQAAEKALQGLVAGARASRVERLAGQFLGETIHNPDDIQVLLVAGDDRRHVRFKQATKLAEHFVDWFDWYQQQEKEKDHG